MKKDVNPKDAFIQAFEKLCGMLPQSFKQNPKGFANIVNSDPELVFLFRQAVKSVMESDEPQAGLNLLFPND